MSDARARIPDQVTDNIPDDQELVLPAGLIGTYFSEELQQFARERAAQRQAEAAES